MSLHTSNRDLDLMDHPDIMIKRKDDDLLSNWSKGSDEVFDKYSTVGQCRSYSKIQIKHSPIVN